MMPNGLLRFTGRRPVCRPILITSGNSISKTPGKAKSDKAKEGEEDALSFNFLYYIIENYKFSDLMDK